LISLWSYRIVRPLQISKDTQVSASVLSSKGQIVIPKDVRDKLGVQAGDRIQFIEDDGGFKIVPATRDIRELKGIVPKPSKPVSIDDMNAVIRARAARALKAKR
jgi:antitoxin PrlF